MPAINTAQRNNLKSPMLLMAASTNAAKPAAGPLTLSFDLLNNPITMPPIIPEIIPLKNGAPDANDMPRQRGRATRNTTILAGISVFKFFKVIRIGTNILHRTLMVPLRIINSELFCL